MLSSFFVEPQWANVTIAIVVTFCFDFFVLRKRRSRKGGDNNIIIADDTLPWAPGWIPVLGHAISYRRDPAGFLLDACQQVGPIFQVNLAGKQMIIVAGYEAQKQVAKAPERILSARQAVADIGFEQTLGNFNVHQGTDLHKGIVKGIWQRGDVQEEVTRWKHAMSEALTKESTVSPDGEYEFLDLIRRVVLRASISRMIGPSFLDGFEEFLDEFMSFQDKLEDVTAKAVVMPQWIALPFMLNPVAAERLKLQQKISQRLDELLASKDEKWGFWLEQMYPRFSTPDVAEYIVGLLFAAHKNPAIGAAQSYLMAFEQCTEEERDAIRKDARGLLSSGAKWNDQETALYRLCLETLRLTAHSIGAVRKVCEPFEITMEQINKHTPEEKPTKVTYNIPIGASIALTHITPSKHPALWGEQASKFDIKAHSVDQYQDEYKFTTFSNGVHKCPGQQLALVMLQHVVSLLLEDYDVLLPDTIPGLSFERATLAQREGPVKVRITKK